MRHLALTFFSLAMIAGVSLGAANVVKHQAAKDKSIGIDKEADDYMIFDKNNFKRTPGMKTLDVGTMSAVARSFGGKLKKTMKHVNGFVVTMPDKPNLVDLPDGWVASKVQHYHVPLATRYEKVEDLICPNGQAPACQTSPTCPDGQTPVCPGPKPGPGPTPRPGTVSWGLDATHALEAQALVDTSTMRVAVIDTGFDMNHPDRPKIRTAISMVDGSPVQDKAGHGTHCVGIISTGGNRIASGSKAEIDVCKGLNDNGSGTSVDLTECEVAISKLTPPPDAVSMSWGSTQSDAGINQGIQLMVNAGIEVFVAAGNSGLTNNPGISWPAQVGCSNPHVHAITSSNSGGTISGYSSWGPCANMIVPGEDIVSLKANSQGYVSMSGTSMSTPLAAALWITAKKAGKVLKFKSLGLPQTKQGQGQPDALLSVQ